MSSVMVKQVYRELVLYINSKKALLRCISFTFVIILAYFWTLFFIFELIDMLFLCSEVTQVSTFGSPRRCGGQGDILSGRSVMVLPSWC